MKLNVFKADCFVVTVTQEYVLHIKINYEVSILLLPCPSIVKIPVCARFS